ncbi:TetR/AcrR family transcriptional regulator C-terminal domain-containing protein [Microbacterium halotolerans]|uniref:TetR/AcrR family transcriptional regulator C-terminal domain-containing protein n=1 Tax=Microbacterium halotolerans TaxID=246613 RepID=UPI000E6ABB5B|nr:TetR/AcrR family transcriptional regulator C-terminal domain-containing protein [Microbacterium halotolerans]
MPNLDAAAPSARGSLSRERVLEVALALADRKGIDALTMRALAKELGIEAMSLYHYVAGKNDLLDGLAEAVAMEVESAVADQNPGSPREWKRTLRRRILTSREVMLRHRWAPGVFEGRASPSAAIVRYFDASIALMRFGGLSYDLVHHALHALGSRLLGFSQELFDPAGSADEDASQGMPAQMVADAPHIVEMVANIAHDDGETTLGRCDDQAEFEFGLDLVLDGLERVAAGR